jgi:hypothetical protein
VPWPSGLSSPTMPMSGRGSRRSSRNAASLSPAGSKVEVPDKACSHFELLFSTTRFECPAEFR